MKHNDFFQRKPEKMPCKLGLKSSIILALICGALYQPLPFLTVTVAQATETASDQAAQARQLKMEGTQLQLQGKDAEAIKKYRESLALQPDPKLENLTTQLEKKNGTAEPPAPAPELPKAPVAEMPPPTPIKTEPPVQAIAQPAIPEAVIPAAVAPANVDDSFGQYRLVEKLSSSLQGGVIKGSETEVYINLGQVHGVPEGMLFEIVRPGAPIKVGNEVIGHEETKIATAEATTVRDKLSICQLKEKGGIPQTGDKVYQQRKKVKRLVVGQFTYNQGMNQFTKTVQEKLVTAFAAKGIQVVERDKLEKVLEEQKLGYSGLIDMDSAKKIGQLLGAEGIVLGTISDMGNDISLNGRMVDIGTGDTLSAGEVNLVKTPLVVQLLEAQVEGSAIGSPKTKPSAGAKTSGNKKLETQEVEGFEFAINGCKKSGNSVTCTYTITNKQEDRTLRCLGKHNKGSGMFDNFGNSYGASQIQLANCKDQYECTMGLVQNVNTMASVTMSDVSSEATNIPKTGISCNVITDRDHGDIFNVSFRDVVINEK